MRFVCRLVQPKVLEVLVFKNYFFIAKQFQTKKKLSQVFGVIKANYTIHYFGFVLICKKKRQLKIDKTQKK